MRIVHCSQTPCAGAIYALHTAINEYTEHESRFISHGGKVNNLTFPYDLTWDFAETNSVLAMADIVVVHQNMNRDMIPLRDFLLGDPNKKLAAFYHSHPGMCDRAEYERGTPAFCVAQYQALLWETATPVRNVIRFDRADWPERDDERARRADPDKIWIGYAPTFRQTQKDQEPGSAVWYHSKGYDVTMPVLEQINDAFPEQIEVMVFEGVPYDQCIRGKAMCDIWIDEVVTGSYHRSALEALALGIPTLCNISPEVHGIILKAAGANDIPVIHATPETLEEQLRWLVEMKPDKRRRLGNAGRDWMVRHWNPRDIAKDFCEKLISALCPEAGG